MTKSFTEKYQHVYQLNINLLALARQGNWDEFIAMAERYVILLSEILDQEFQCYSAEEREQIGPLLLRLTDNEAEINNTLKNRLNVLKREVSALRLGKKCSQAYSAPFSPTFH